MSRYSIKKCICHDRSFSVIKKFAVDNEIDSVQELQEHQICSCGCQMCVPYIELMLETGKTEFEPGAHYKNKKQDEKA